MITNILQIQEKLRNLSDGDLRNVAMGKSPLGPGAALMAVSAIKLRNDQRREYEARLAAERPQTTVAEDILKGGGAPSPGPTPSLSPSGAGGLGALPPLGSGPPLGGATPRQISRPAVPQQMAQVMPQPMPQPRPAAMPAQMPAQMPPRMPMPRRMDEGGPVHAQGGKYLNNLRTLTPYSPQSRRQIELGEIMGHGVDGVMMGRPEVPLSPEAHREARLALGLTLSPLAVLGGVVPASTSMATPVGVAGTGAALATTAASPAIDWSKMLIDRYNRPPPPNIPAAPAMPNPLVRKYDQQLWPPFEAGEFEGVVVPPAVQRAIDLQAQTRRKGSAVNEVVSGTDANASDADLLNAAVATAGQTQKGSTLTPGYLSKGQDVVLEEAADADLKLDTSALTDTDTPLTLLEQFKRVSEEQGIGADRKKLIPDRAGVLLRAAAGALGHPTWQESVQKAIEGGLSGVEALEKSKGQERDRLLKLLTAGEAADVARKVAATGERKVEGQLDYWGVMGQDLKNKHTQAQATHKLEQRKAGILESYYNSQAKKKKSLTEAFLTVKDELFKGEKKDTYFDKNGALHPWAIQQTLQTIASAQPSRYGTGAPLPAAQMTNMLKAVPGIVQKNARAIAGGTGGPWTVVIKDGKLDKGPKAKSTKDAADSISLIAAEAEKILIDEILSYGKRKDDRSRLGSGVPKKTIVVDQNDPRLKAPQ